MSIATSLVAASGLGLLLFLEQRRSLHSSDLATIYLVVSIIYDFVFLTIPSERPLHPDVSRVLFVRLVIHSILLILECCPRQASTSNECRSPEESSGALSMVFFTWINPFLLLGYRNILIDRDLPPLSQDIKPEHTRKAILRAWDQRGQSIFLQSI